MVTYILKGKGRSVEERERIPKRAIVAELKPEEGDIVIGFMRILFVGRHRHDRVDEIEGRIG